MANRADARLYRVVEAVKGGRAGGGLSNSFWQFTQRKFRQWQIVRLRVGTAWSKQLRE
jgi:hypothetical protein